MLNYKIQIDYFHIKCFRIFSEIELSLKDHTYYSLVGKNGLGKTSLLEGINICLSENTSKFNSIKETDFFCDDPIEFIVQFNKPFFLSYPEGQYSRLLPCKKFTKRIKRRNKKATNEIFSSPYVINVEYELIEYPRLNTKAYQEKSEQYSNLIPSDSKIVWSLQKTDEGYGYTTSSSDDLHIIKQHELLNLDRVLFPKVFYFDKERDRELNLGYNTIFSDIVEELDWRFNKNLKEQEKKAVIVEKYNEIHHEISIISDHKNELIQPAFKILNNHLGVDFNFDGFNFFFFNHSQPFSKAVFGHITSKNVIVDVQRIGSGISMLVALSILITFAEKSKNPLIFLIDEPELHLHSDLQKKLCQLLKERPFQTLVSTHSHLFLDKVGISNNLSFTSNLNTVNIDPCNQLTLGITIFGLLGNSLEDLYIPENLILVEGKYDKQILIKCLTLLKKADKSLLILDCGGTPFIPQKGDLLEQFFEKYINNNAWYSKYINSKFRLIIDGDVTDDRVNYWKNKFRLSDEQIKHLEVKCIEYLYPEVLIKHLVKDKMLKDGSKLEDKLKDEIIEIILNDEKIRSKSNRESDVKQEKEHLISKQRLNEYVSENLTNEILELEECKDLKRLSDWL